MYKPFLFHWSLKSRATYFLRQFYELKLSRRTSFFYYKFLELHVFDVELSAANYTKQWAHWLKLLENFLNVMDTEGVTDDVKLNFLMNHISSSVYEYIIEWSTYAVAVETPKELYEEPTSEVFARDELLSCLQEECKSLDQFMKSLKQLRIAISILLMLPKTEMIMFEICSSVILKQTSSVKEY